MQWEGNLRKLGTSERPDEYGQVNYALQGANVINELPEEPINDWVGKRMIIEYNGQINCRVTGQLLRKSYGEGMSYQTWMEHPSAVPSVLRPELSRIHEGIALRDFDWEQKHHNQPHFLYISHTGDFKVGVTRTTNCPFRWHDQGAVSAIAIALTPYRQLAGEMEVALKEILSDKTNYRKMLLDVQPKTVALDDLKEECFEHLGAVYESFFIDESPQEFKYPVMTYPSKVTSLKLDKTPRIEGMLQGIKGQYLMFDGGRVLNLRRHSGYWVRIQAGR